MDVCGSVLYVHYGRHIFFSKIRKQFLKACNFCVTILKQYSKFSDVDMGPRQTAVEDTIFSLIIVVYFRSSSRR